MDVWVNTVVLIITRNIGDVVRLVGQNSKQLSNYAQYTHWSKNLPCNDLSYTYTHSLKALDGAVTGCGKSLAK